MKSNSDHYPELVISSNGKTQIRYNIVETIKEDMDEKPRISYDFNYVEIEGEATKEKIVEAIVLAETPKEPEIIVVNQPIIETKVVDIKMVETAIIEAKAAIQKIVVPIKK
jgi:hypothetical protein